jgi:hypothetical protein
VPAQTGWEKKSRQVGWLKGVRKRCDSRSVEVRLFGSRSKLRRRKSELRHYVTERGIARWVAVVEGEHQRLDRSPVLNGCVLGRQSESRALAGTHSEMFRVTERKGNRERASQLDGLSVCCTRTHEPYSSPFQGTG